MNANAIQVFNFHGADVRATTIDGEPWFVGKDIAERLGYERTADAIRAHVEEEDKGVCEMPTPGGKQSMTVINESGMYSLILSSKLPAAKEFKHWVTSEVLPALRKTGTYTVKRGRVIDPAEMELKKKRLAIQEMNAATRQAKLAYNLIKGDKVAITNDSKLILVREIIKTLTGADYPQLLPDSFEPLYSASDVAKAIGGSITNRKVMKEARKYSIVPPEGCKNEFGRWKLSKTRNSNRECSQWFFSEAGRDALIDIITECGTVTI